VITGEAGEKAKHVRISTTGRPATAAAVVAIDTEHDLALLSTEDPTGPPETSTVLPPVGKQVVFAGLPQGVKRISVFPGMVSAVGNDLVRYPRCQLIQISGMINNGNSGGPLLDVDSSAVVGMITAKYVPLLVQIDELARGLKAIPQFPSSVGIGDIDFAKFVNLTIQSMWKLAAVLRLVQVGTGWAVPARYFARVGVK
jgi:S1-C subfamily serine protease